MLVVLNLPLFKTQECLDEGKQLISTLSRYVPQASRRLLHLTVSYLLVRSSKPSWHCLQKVCSTDSLTAAASHVFPFTGALQHSYTLIAAVCTCKMSLWTPAEHGASLCSVFGVGLQLTASGIFSSYTLVNELCVSYFRCNVFQSDDEDSWTGDF